MQYGKDQAGRYLGGIGKEKFWESHLAAQARSGLTQAEYCRRAGLGISSFRAFKRKLAAVMDKAPQLMPVRVVSDRPANAFPQEHERPGLVLLTGNGHRVEIRDHFQPSTLERLLYVLGVATR